MKKFTLKVKSLEHWEEIYNTLCGISSCCYIPDRKVCCTDIKNHSQTRGTFELEDYEAEDLKNHPYIDWIELSPTDNPDAYPEPQPATKRFKRDVKVYRDLEIYAPPQSNPTIAENNRTNWAIKRVGIQTNGDAWPIPTGTQDVIYSDVSYSLTGKNVDIVIHDSGIMQYHPEFIDENGQSRVRDIVLDGPYYIDPDYFILNNLTYTKTDGRIGIATTSAVEWWGNNLSRSSQFISEGTISIPQNYTENNTLGIGGTINNLISGHGTACAGLAAGKYMGLAFDANIWSMPAIGDNTDIVPETSYDLIKIWHRNKPINQDIGIPNPTVVNGSWGFQAGFYSSSTVNYRFRGSTGSFVGISSIINTVTAMKEGLLSQVPGAYKSWASSSRSNSVDEAANEMMAEGIIYIASAGNNNQRLTIGADDQDRLNYMSDTRFNTTDPRIEFPTRTVPCNHRDWMNPLGIGFDSINDFHPVVAVGAMDDYVYPNGSERKAPYSNNGPGVDVWAPADEMLAPGTNGVAGYEVYQRYDNPDFYDCTFVGTSAAAPVVTGLVALYLESNPNANSRDVKSWLKRHGSLVVGNDLYLDEYSDVNQSNYWTQLYNLRGAERRILYDSTANDLEPSIKNISISGITFTQT